jgi:hypothetical protein
VLIGFGRRENDESPSFVAVSRDYSIRIDCWRYGQVGNRFVVLGSGAMWTAVLNSPRSPLFFGGAVDGANDALVVFVRLCDLCAFAPLRESFLPLSTVPVTCYSVKP